MATRADVDRMAAVVSDHIWTELAPTLSPFEYALLADTQIYVDERPSPALRQLARTPDGGHLLGIFTAPPATITLYADEILQARADPVEIGVHELGHRFGYDHSRYEAAIAMMAPADGGSTCEGCADAPLTEIPQPPPAQGSTRVIRWRDNCPVCLLHARLAEADRLLAGAAQYSTLQHRIPEGLGGTIPLAAAKVDEAVALEQVVETMMAERAGELRQLRVTLGQAQVALRGWLDVAGVNRAYTAVHRCWQMAYQVAWSYFSSSHATAPAMVLDAL